MELPASGDSMLKARPIKIAKVRVPVKRAKTLDPAKADAIAEDMLENGQTVPIQVREDGDGYVLIEGLHRLEARKALGDAEIDAYLVQARKH